MLNKKSWIIAIAALIIGTFALLEGAFAKEDNAVYKNPETGYTVAIDDREDLLTEEEEAKLLEDMRPITEFGNVAFLSCYVSGQDTGPYARDWYYSNYGNDSGTAFVIDMGNRNIYIVSAGKVYSTVTKGYANSITDNVYRMASRGDYYGCASEAFAQEYKLLQGGYISRPMKHITNALVAIILAILGNFVLAMSQRKGRTARAKHVFTTTTASTLSTEVLAKNYVKTRTYSVSDDDDDGGGGLFSMGGGGFSGGGFSGGGFSGGGGGHGF